MNSENNVMQDAGYVPAQGNKNNGKNNDRKSRARRDISAEAAHVPKFLNSCTLYQADAVRVIVCHATGNGRYEKIAAADRLAVNRFLNYGMNKGNTPSADAVMKFRVERSEVLLKALRPCCSQAQILKATVALMCITTDTEAVKKAFETFPDSK